MNLDSKIYIAGHRGLAGSAIVRMLKASGYHNQITRSHSELDLEETSAVRDFLEEEKPDIIFLAAAKVGGIHANNTQPADFIYKNLMVECNVIHQAHLVKVKKLIFLGSSCIYPREAPQPLREEYLLSGKPEPTNRAYAIAKIAGIELCQSYHRQYGDNFISLMPTNLFGPGDNFDLQSSHVLAALIHKIHLAQVNGDSEVVLWGTGTPQREFLYSDDLGRACVFLMENYDSDEFINVGTGLEMTIKELAQRIAAVIGFEGSFTFDSTKPDGSPRKVMDISKIKKLGWQPQVSMDEGLHTAYQWFKDHFLK